MKKRRITLKASHDEAAVVAPIDFWAGLEEHCISSAIEFPEYATGWQEAAAHINEWVERTKDKHPLYDEVE